jgi:hypothetical protein
VVVVVVRRGRRPLDGDFGASGGRQRVEAARDHARDARVHIQHHHQRQEERAHGREDHVAPVPVVATRLVGVTTRLVPVTPSRHFSFQVLD